MSRFRDLAFVTAITLFAGSTVSAQTFPGIGRIATAKEIAAWDIDVRPDFKGLPKGSGTVVLGQDVWEGKCASCHGVFGESNNVFTPLIGGTTQKDIETGRVASLIDGKTPQRTTMMKVPTVSTLWDYINRAMPWNAPKTLTTEEVYAVTAYILNMAEVVPADFTLSDKNIAEVQKRMPNRNGMTKQHGLWQVNGSPDVRNTACMSNCAPPAKVDSFLPDTAKGANGNLAEQNRAFGPVRGVKTVAAVDSDPKANAVSRPTVPTTATAAAAGTSTPAPGKGMALLNQYGCVACHGMANKIVGPGFAEITAKYKGDGGAPMRLYDKVKNGGSGVWGPIPMPPQPAVKDEDIKSIVHWILTGN